MMQHSNATTQSVLTVEGKDPLPTEKRRDARDDRRVYLLLPLYSISSTRNSV